MPEEKSDDLPDPADLCSVAEAARALGVNHSTIWRWVKSGRLPALRLGPRSIRIRRADLGGTLNPVESAGARELRDERVAWALPVNERRQRDDFAAEQPDVRPAPHRTPGAAPRDSAPLIRASRELRSRQVYRAACGRSLGSVKEIVTDIGSLQPLDDEEREYALLAFEELRAFRLQLLAERNGERFPDSGPDIRAAREERLRRW